MRIGPPGLFLAVRKGNAMHLDLNPTEAGLVHLLLTKELEDTRVEIHHAKNIEYKQELSNRERLVHDLLARFPGAGN